MGYRHLSLFATALFLSPSFAFRILLGVGDNSEGGANSEELRFDARLGVEGDGDDEDEPPEMHTISSFEHEEEPLGIVVLIFATVGRGGAEAEALFVGSVGAVFVTARKPGVENVETSGRRTAG